MSGSPLRSATSSTCDRTVRFVTVLTIATRGSALARWQSDHVAGILTRSGVVSEVRILEISTEGDRRRDVPLSEIGGKGVFVKEVQAAVIDGRADLAVHSAKDLPAVTPDELVIGGVPERADPRDGLVGAPLAEIPEGGTIATGSGRRAVQLLEARPDLRIVDLRGNMDTRIAKAAEHDAVVVAVAALTRLGLEDRLAEVLEPSVMLPQVGQGTLAIECRAADERTRAALRVLDHPPSRSRLVAERAFLVELGGDCDLPAGAFAEAGIDGLLRVRGLLADGPDVRDSTIHRGELTGSDPVELGTEVARLVAAGSRGSG